MAPNRFHIEPRDVPAKGAALRLGMAEAKFMQELPLLIARGFPKPDETTGNFDLHAIDAWCDRRHPQLFLTVGQVAIDARSGVVADRLRRARNGTS